MTPILVEVLKEAIVTLAGAAFVGLAGIIGFHFSKLTSRIKRKDLIEEVELYVLWAEQKDCFQDKTNEEKYNAVFEKGMNWASDNGVNVGVSEMDIIVESAVKRMKQQDNKRIGEERC